MARKKRKSTKHRTLAQKLVRAKAKVRRLEKAKKARGRR